MHKKEQIQRLYRKFLDNECSRKEFDTLLDLVKNMEDKEEMSRLTYGILKAEKARQAPRKTFSSGHKDKVFKQAMAGERGRDTPVLPTYNKNYSWYKVAAVLLLVTTAAFLIY